MKADRAFELRGSYRDGSWVSDNVLIVWKPRRLRGKESWPIVGGVTRRSDATRVLRSLLSLRRLAPFNLKEARTEIREAKKFQSRRAYFSGLAVDADLLALLLSQMGAKTYRYRISSRPSRVCHGTCYLWIDLVGDNGSRGRLMGMS